MDFLYSIFFQQKAVESRVKKSRRIGTDEFNFNVGFFKLTIKTNEQPHWLYGVYPMETFRVYTHRNMHMYTIRKYRYSQAGFFCRHIGIFGCCSWQRFHTKQLTQRWMMMKKKNTNSDSWISLCNWHCRITSSSQFYIKEILYLTT